jgi:DnaJ-class molecular chaperone
MPKPKDGESESDFMSRCIPMVMNENSKDKDQATTMCSSMFSGKKLCRICSGKGTVERVVRNSTGGKTKHYDECKTCNGKGLI